MFPKPKSSTTGEDAANTALLGEVGELKQSDRGGNR